MENIYTLGQRIIIDSYLKRVSKYIQEQKESPYKAEFKVWEEVRLKEPIKGIVIGVRKLSNGKNHWIPDSGNDYEPKEHFKALLVAYHLNRKPLLVKLLNQQPK